MTPVVHRVVGRRRETDDVVTIQLEPVSGTRLEFRPGQFNMLSAFGIGEAAISLSGAPRDPGPLRHTVRDVGPVSHALCQSDVGDLVGVRGPFGSDWRIGDRSEDGRDRDTVVVAGGIGLAPLRGAVQELVAASRENGGRVFVLVGARDPSQIIFNEDLQAWADDGAYVDLTVDRASAQWSGRVGLVTTLLGRAPFDPARTRALICGPEIMMRFTARVAREEHGVRPRLVRSLPTGSVPPVPRRAGGGVRRRRERSAGGARAMSEISATDARPTLAVWKFASCDGCQLSLLDCEDELLALAGAVRIAHFTEMSRTSTDGPYDISLVEGSITTPDDAERIQQVRRDSRHLVTIGACATAGGIQGLRNFAAEGAYAGTVYAHPEYLKTLETSTPISDHVAVDYELHGCPIDRRQLLEVLLAFLAGRRPAVAGHSVCQECKGRSNVCVMVANATPCLGPVTRAGCGGLCPSVGRGCFGCFGPSQSANTISLADQLSRNGATGELVSRLFRTFNANAPVFRAESERQSARGDA